jgi:xanthine dehydrogenase YagS FAD-binding subunit
MKPFAYIRAASAAEARAAAAAAGHRFLAGGTTLLDLMKCGVETPAALIDIGRLEGLDRIAAEAGTLSIGALARMSRVAGDASVARLCPAVAESLRQAASPQLRNMASIGGNLMQRTRCAYFRDPKAFPACNKRAPGSGCTAIGGVTRNHAVLGTSRYCIATYPGDLAVALTAFDASLLIEGDVPRRVAIADFFPLPDDTPHIEHPIAAGELIVGIEIPLTPAAARSVFIKLRDRGAYEFAVAAVAAGIELDPDDRTVRDVRVALGGVATIPWRAVGVEAALIGRRFDADAIATASQHAAKGAVARGGNGFKVELIRRLVVRALTSLGGDGR